MALEDLDDDDGGGEEGAPAWMATFSDLCSLLLTFFVLLLSFANLDAKEFREMLGSAREAFGVQRKHKGHIEGLATTVVELSDKEAHPWSAMTSKEASAMTDVARYVKKKSLDGDVEVTLNERGVIVRMKDRLAFKAGSDELTEAAKPVLDKVRELIGTFSEGLSIEGHTDDRPISTLRFPSNWELSAARASSVLRYMQRASKLAVQELRVTGHADRKPLVPNDSDENRAINRRVEFIFEREAPSKRDLKADPGVDEAMKKLRLTPKFAGLPQGPESSRPGDVFENPSNVEYKIDLSSEEAQAVAAEAAKEQAQRASAEPADGGVTAVPEPLPLDSPERLGKTPETPSQVEIWKAQLRELQEQEKQRDGP